MVKACNCQVERISRGYSPSNGRRETATNEGTRRSVGEGGARLSGGYKHFCAGHEGEGSESLILTLVFVRKSIVLLRT